MTPSLTSPIVSGVRVSGGPLCKYIGKYRTQSEGLGYAPSMVLIHLRAVAKFDLWLRLRKQRLCDVNERVVGQFLDRLRVKRPGAFRSAITALRHLLRLLRNTGATQPSKEVRSPAGRLTDDYRMFLSNERGLDRATIYNYSRHIDRFLSERYGTGRVDLGDLQASEITAFVRREAPRFGRGQAAQVVTGLRSFLRFARYRGQIRVDLAAAVPCVANWALAGLPKGLPKGAVEQVLAHCNRSTVTGKRNYAILLLLARLGLRAGEIVAMRLEDMDWERAEITVRSKKGGGWARLPLPADVGKAIAEYLEGRPRSPYRNLFVRDYAPYTPFVASGPISVLVMKALKKAGVKSARTGAHVFRHTLATKMLKNGASLDEIGQVLRHKDPDTTAIYAKVDIEALRKLALPWPGGVR